MARTRGRARFTLQFGPLRYELICTQFSHLAVTPGAAQIEGTCTINGVGGFDFTVSVIESRSADGRDATKLRLQARDTATDTLVLDTQPSSAK